MYGRTNKRDATRQIGRHVRRLERAELAVDRHRLSKRSTTHTAGGKDDIDHDLEKHYQISKSRRDPVNIYTYVHKNNTDPAFNVCDCLLWMFPESVSE